MNVPVDAAQAVVSGPEPHPGDAMGHRSADGEPKKIVKNKTHGPLSILDVTKTRLIDFDDLRKTRSIQMNFVKLDQFQFGLCGAYCYREPRKNMSQIGIKWGDELKLVQITCEQWIDHTTYPLVF